MEPMPASDRPLVSVIVPVYNTGEFLASCIESLLAQTYDPIELICVDDGSTDGSAEVLAAFAAQDARMRVIRQENAGPGVARNRGIDEARGDYLYFFDADDFCDPALLETVMDRMLAADADLAVFPFMEYNQHAGVERRPSWGLLGDKFTADVFSWHDNPDWIFEAFHNYPWNKVVKASLVHDQAIRYQEIYLTEDLMFAGPCLALAQRIVWVDAPLVHHRIASGMNVMAHKDAHPLDFIEAFKAFKAFLEERGLFDDLRIAYVNWALNACEYNLNTLNTPEGYRTVFDALAQSGLRDLGLADMPDGDIRYDGYRELLDALKQGDAVHYAYRHYAGVRDDRDFLDFLARWRLDEMDRLWRAADEQREREAARAADYERRIEELETEFAAYRAMHESIMNAAEQKIGNAICYVPRIVQRKILGAKRSR